ncbi:nuclear transport factor 2 family protein [Nocardia sp. NPDC051570]|uniref:nuclear transport factor 2 family protein n=1 Tax=Nocardia sp. NPDC051570 TaxID=3364324 RepID=UPI0037B17520
MTTIRRSAVTAVAVAAVGLAGVSALTACGSDKSDKPQAQGNPAIATDWEAAWNNSDPQRLAALFTTDDSRYTDHAFDRTYHGHDGMVEWASNTKKFIPGASIKVNDAFGGADKVAINWTFSGQLAGAPKPFSVPAVAVLQLRGNQIVSDDDYYNFADVVRQSGLPADTNFG